VRPRHDGELRVTRVDYDQQRDATPQHAHASSAAAATFARALLLLKPARALPALANGEPRALKVEHYLDRAVKLVRPVVHLGVTSGSPEPRLFCFLNCGRFGPRSVSSSRMLYRKKLEKLEQIE
jgi:hypothetical protein